ncbi:MAG TPA: helix-turn-helix transcriptional regulator [Flavobacterium sp.]|nr:helix-turn-helix transcriptional regulator [Flavobacterium sp.]
MMIKNAELKVKNIRELKNLTQEYMANQLNLSLRAYSKIESGETQLTINRINEISNILNVNPLELLGFDEKNIFNIHNSTGNNGYNLINSSDKMIEHYEETIEFLKEQNKTLLSIIEKMRS